MARQRHRSRNRRDQDEVRRLAPMSLGLVGVFLIGVLLVLTLYGDQLALIEAQLTRAPLD